MGMWASVPGYVSLYGCMYVCVCVCVSECVYVSPELFNLANKSETRDCPSQLETSIHQPLDRHRFFFPPFLSLCKENGIFILPSARSNECDVIYQRWRKSKAYPAMD